MHVPAAEIGALWLAARWGGPLYAVPLAIAGGLGFDSFYIPPTREFGASHWQNWLVVFIYISMGLLIGVLGSHAQRRAEASERARGRLADDQAALRRVATLVAEGSAPEGVFNAVAREVGLLLGVDAAHECLAGVSPRPPGRLDLEMVAAPRLDADHLPGAGGPDSLLGRLVTLDLRHRGLTLLWLPVPGARTVRCFSPRALPRLMSASPRPVVSSPAPTQEPVRPLRDRSPRGSASSASSSRPSPARRSLPSTCSRPATSWCCAATTATGAK